jgi:broad specificity phosphatase PhoE
MMTTVPFAILRHATTAWNESGRLQGMTDIPLSPAGIALAKGWHLPAPADAWKRICSPLRRACETATLLQPAASFTIDARLREMSFGEWEGRTLADLRTTVGQKFLDAERRGLDFQPPGGESPRMVMARISEWTAEIARMGEPVVAVSHKAAIRALLALATGWDMQGRQPVRLDWHCLHFFAVHRDGQVTLERPNVSLVPETVSAE